MNTFEINVTVKTVHTFQVEGRTRTDAIMELSKLLISDDPYANAESFEIDRRVSTPMKVGSAERDVKIELDS